MQIKGGTASKGEARVDNNGRLLVDVQGAGGAALEDAEVALGASSAALSAGYQSVPAGAGGPLTVTAPVDGKYICSYNVHSILSNVEVVSEMGARITVNGTPVTGSDINCGRNQLAGIGAVRHGNGNAVPLSLSANDVVELEVFASPGSGNEQVASFSNSGVTQLRLQHIGS